MRPSRQPSTSTERSTSCSTSPKFHWEKTSSWGADLHFGHEFHHKIERVAIVGDKKWEQHLASLASPFSAKDSKYFENDDDAWAWPES